MRWQERISAEAWGRAAQLLADHALEGNIKDDFEVAAAMRVLAIAAYQMQEAIEAKEKTDPK